MHSWVWVGLQAGGGRRPTREGESWRPAHLDGGRPVIGKNRIMIKR